MLLSYGSETIPLEWPNGANPSIITYPAAISPGHSLDHVAAALRSPIESPPLSQLAVGRHQAVILVSDVTRLCPTAELLPPLLDELNEGGLPDERIRIVVALGTHRVQTDAELRSIAGVAFSRVAVENHSAALEDCVHVGVTALGTPALLNRNVVEADLRIAIGNIEPHALVGLSGGGKALFPGVAASVSIERHHALSLRYAAVPGYAENPLYRDIEQICEMVPLHFLLNVVVDHRKQVLGAFAGSVGAAHAAGGRFARQQFLVSARRKYDVVIASAGGAPKDMQLYQAIKSLENAAGFAKPGGDILLIAKCEELYGNGTFQAWNETHANRARAIERLGKEFVLGAHKLHRLHKLTSKHNVFLFSSVPPPLAALLGVEPAEDIQAWADRRFAAKLDAAVIPCASLTFPAP